MTGFTQRVKGKFDVAWRGFYQGGAQSVAPFFNVGAPTNGGGGTLAGFAPKGALLVTDEPALYQNTNTQTSPTWTAVGSGGGGALSSVTVALSANQLNHLFSAPVTILAAPGAGKANLVIGAFLAMHVGTIMIDSESGLGSIFLGSASGIDLVLRVDNQTTSKIQASGGVPSTVAPILYTAIANQPVVAAGLTEDLVNGGSIATATVGAGGLGYAPGDTGSVNPQTTAVYVVDTVGAGGAVTAFHFSDRGYGNNVGNGKTTNVSTGAGNGAFTINTTGITPGNGTASVTVLYQTITLP